MGVWLRTTLEKQKEEKEEQEKYMLKTQAEVYRIW
jgi:hypothetical protein